MYNPQGLRIRTLRHFFSSFRSRKKCEETTRLAKGKEHVKHVIRVSQFKISIIELYS